MYRSDPPESPPRHATRHRIARFAALAAFALLAGCQSAPKAENPGALRPAPSEAVRALGFTESADGAWMINFSDAILFRVNSDELNPETEQRLAQLAQDLLRAGVRRLRIEGHTDNSGSRAYNLELSQRRADAVAQAFVANGFAPDAVERRGLAFDYPVASNGTADGRARNRRVTVMVASEEIASR